MLKHISKYYETECRFNGVYSRDNLPKIINDRACVINLDEYADVETHCIALCVLSFEIIYFDNFGVKHVLKEIKIFIGHKNIKANLFRTQAKNSVMCEYFCIELINFMLVGRTLIDSTYLLYPYGFQKNDNIILSYFKNERKSIETTNT